jgi:hypothetical protein
MATVSINRPDLFGASATVGIYPAAAMLPGHAPSGSALASGTTDSAGALSVTDAAIPSNTRLVAYAAGTGNYCRCRSTLDVEDRGTAVGTADTTSGSASLANVSASSGAFAQGQRISGPGIPAGTRLISGSGGSWVMSTAATASASGVAVAAEGARVAAAGLGSATVPQTIATTWQSRVLQRRVAAGTS